MSSTSVPVENDTSEAEVCPLKLMHFYIESDFWACDAKMTLFVAAVNNDPYHMLLKMFPQSHISETAGPEIEMLYRFIRNAPQIEHLPILIYKENLKDTETEVLNLMCYVLLKQYELRLHTVWPDEYEELLSTMGQSNNLPRPTAVFLVKNASVTLENLPVGQLKVKGQRKLAFYTDTLVKFNSILTSSVSNGQHNYLENASDEAQPPLLLNTDLAVSIEMSPWCTGWRRSGFGSAVKCVAVCSLDDQAGTIIWSEKSTEVLVPSSGCMEICYLLFYGSHLDEEVYEQESEEEQVPEEEQHSEEEQELEEWTWLERNKYILVLAGSLVLIASIGVLNSSAGRHWRPVLKRGANFLWEGCRRFFNLA